MSISRSRVREGELTRHAAARLENGRSFAVTSGLGLPRGWSYSTSAVMWGFSAGLDETKPSPSASQPGVIRGAQRALHVADRARRSLVDACDRLVERQAPDASLVAVLIDQGELHVVSAGPGRVYLHRAGKPQRLTPRDEVGGGLLRAHVTHCSSPLEPGDLIMAGSVSAFSMKSIAQTVSALSADPRTPPSVLANVLTEPAGQAGVGAAAIVLRVM